MSCYHPMMAVRDRSSDRFKIVGSVPDFEFFKKNVYPDKECIQVPCGQCRGCRLDKSRQWADRMCLEYDHTKKACFLTLTYDQEHLPLSDTIDAATGEVYPTLVKDHLSTFMKDLRGNKHFENTELRFYGSGEYGDRRGRPHLHIILFGAEPKDFDWPEENSPLVLSGANELHQAYYRSRILEETIWKKGMCCIADFSWETAAYTSRYVRKKLNGKLSSVYNVKGQQAPFALMSRNPGIAGHYHEDHPEQNFLEFQNFSVNGKIMRIPDFVFEKVLDNTEMDKLKSQRRKYANDSILMKLQKTDLSFEELLAIEESKSKHVSTMLSRNLE